MRRKGKDFPVRVTGTNTREEICKEISLIK